MEIQNQIDGYSGARGVFGPSLRTSVTLSWLVWVRVKLPWVRVGLLRVRVGPPAVSVRPYDIKVGPWSRALE